MKGDDGDDFHQGEPELTLRKEARGNDVQAKYHHAEDHAPRPDGHLREPVLHAEARGGKARAERHRPGEPVEPRHGVARRRAKITRGIDVERAGFRHRHGEFAQTLHHQPDHQRTYQVRQQRARRPGRGNDVAGIEE